MGSIDSGQWATGSGDAPAAVREDGGTCPVQPVAAGVDLSPSLYRPRALAFQLYSSRLRRRQQGHSAFRGGNYFGGYMRPEPPALVIRCTRDIILTFKRCNPSFTYSETFNPRRFLTNPSMGMGNNGLDNCNSELILAVNSVLLHSDASRRYIVKDMLGQGTFGQVAKCFSEEFNGFVAVKIIKNQPAYHRQALVEIGICHMLNHKFDPGDRHHIVRILDHFLFHGHLCLVFELLTENLFELIKHNQFNGISLNLVRTFTIQILDSLTVLRDASVIHCDLKPENILLKSRHSPEVKLIDFGSACMENRTVYSYIQSRFYRSPEVLLGHPYTTAIDMWSLGCVVAELFLGLPLFPGASEYDLLQRMIETLGGQPPDFILRNAKHTSKFFKHSSIQPPENRCSEDMAHSTYQFLTELEYEAREKKKLVSGKRYFKQNRLDDIIVDYPHRVAMTPEQIEKETEMRCALVDFLRGLLHFDPMRRWTPKQAAQHPFLTEQSFHGPFKPVPETPRTPVGHGMVVDHNPGAGHWFGAGLSPQVVPLNAGMHFASPHYQAASLSHASSFGSVGSYGSYDQVGPGSSFGSYSDSSSIFPNFPTPPVAGMNGASPGASGNTVLGLSPDAWRRMAQGPFNGPSVLGHTQLGMSPTSGNGFRPMSLGASPSQFTPPASQLGSPASPSHMSPGRYGPTSPARTNAGTSTLGKGKSSAAKQFAMRRTYGASVSNSNTGPENYWQRQQGNGSGSSEAGSCSYVEGAVRSGSYFRGTVVQAAAYSLPRRQRSVSGLPSTAGPLYHPQTSVPYAPGTLGSLLASPDRGSEGGDDMSPPPDPGDWEPDYSDELLLQNDLAEGSPTTSGFKLTGVMGSGGARLGPGPGSFSGPGPGSYSGPGPGTEDTCQHPSGSLVTVSSNNVGTAGKSQQTCLERPSDGATGGTFFVNGHAYQQPGGAISTSRSSALHQAKTMNGESAQPSVQHGMQQGFVRNMPKQLSSPSRLGPLVQQPQRQHHQVTLQIPLSPDSEPAVGGRGLPDHQGNTNLLQMWGGLSPGGVGGMPGSSVYWPVVGSHSNPHPGSGFANGSQDIYLMFPQDQPSISPPWGSDLFIGAGRNGPQAIWPLPPAPTGRRDYRRP